MILSPGRYFFIPSIAIPHSNPVSTVLTSSLKRLSDRIFPSLIISSSSLTSLTRESLVIVPLSTWDPAIKPIFGILNASLTIASPTISSTRSGFKSPSTANFRSSTAW